MHLSISLSMRSLSKLTVALAFAAIAGQALAATNYLVLVPVPGKTAAATVEEPVSVVLADAALPDAKIGRAYSVDLVPYMQIKGDPNADVQSVAWSIYQGDAGQLPAGLQLDPATGVISGTPTKIQADPNVFQAQATYKSKAGIGTYTIRVGDAVLTAKQVLVGYSHACALTMTNGVKCWGMNGNGQLGNGKTTDSVAPVDVVGLTSGVAQLAVGSGQNCVVTTAGGAKCWGGNYSGQLGDSTSKNNQLTPVDVVGLTSGVKSIATGSSHSCAVLTTGEVRCWGANNMGQLGDRTAVDKITPVTAVGVTAKQVAIGSTSTCVVNTAGGAQCWGANGEGQLGNGTKNNSQVPVDVTGLAANVAYISLPTNAQFACAVTTAGGAKCWGNGASGQLGNSAWGNSLVPVDVTGLTSGVTSLSTGGGHVCATTSAGDTKCWGFNSLGQVSATTGNMFSPNIVLAASGGAVNASAGQAFSCATVGTQVKCWGANGNGQLGDGTKVNSRTPVTVRD
ncbi:hypothetical protein LMG26857_03365 [Achromobacter anxifer]|uniref:putative Ig domain-containing protein n=1 Tax=Achromobacter anxifer TaxID=1287737 RepID=UPI00155D5B3A|nr:putative Ig domain-containing protein [Achromobacter anxifer]CAB5514306.1 hypothetical protein LMG26857_03365 [Achromobacter anxifer]